MRALRLTRRFRVEQNQRAPRGSAAWDLVASTLREMADGPLPLPEDISVDLPPCVMGRVVRGADLILCYLPGVDEVHLIALLPVR